MTSKKSVVIVTGGGSGIGASISMRLANDGHHVFINYNSNQEGALKTKEAIEEKGGSCSIGQFNVSSVVEVETSLNQFFDEFKGYTLYGLVNNAGITQDTLVGFMSDDNFKNVIETNLYGTFYLCRWAIKKMIRSRRGSIVNISSISGQIGNSGQSNYAASKAGIIALTKSLASEVGKRNIRVNAVAPGLIETKMIKDFPNLDLIKENIPLKRIGTPTEVAGVVSFLLSNDASYITGQTISVNGGLHYS